MNALGAGSRIFILIKKRGGCRGSDTWRSKRAPSPSHNWTFHGPGVNPASLTPIGFKYGFRNRFEIWKCQNWISEDHSGFFWKMIKNSVEPLIQLLSYSHYRAKCFLYLLGTAQLLPLFNSRIQYNKWPISRLM